MIKIPDTVTYLVAAGKDFIGQGQTWIAHHRTRFISIVVIHVAMFFVREVAYVNWFSRPLILLLLFFDWIVFARIFQITFQLTRKNSIMIALGIYVAAAVFHFFGVIKIAEYLAVGTYIIMVITIIQMMMDLKKDTSKHK